jgi:hypothetical protein
MLKYTLSGKRLKINNPSILVILAIISASLLVSRPVLPFVATVPISLLGSTSLGAFHQLENLALLFSSDHTPDRSCAQPEPDQVEACHALERQIMTVTARLEWHFWLKQDDGATFVYTGGTTGYGTIKDGRYLVTHNHPGKSLSHLPDEEQATLSLFTTVDDPLLLELPLDEITIAVEEEETLVLDFGMRNGEGRLSQLGLVSAEFKDWASLPLQPQMEVAQIDWDGNRAFVEWVPIEAVIIGSGTPRLRLANYVKPGASGGGVFWNGYHVANTWSRVITYDKNSMIVLHRYSLAALNSAQVTATSP